MRCKLHPYANAVGVCAPCLRDRLLALAAEREDAGDDGSSVGSPPPAAPHGIGGFPRSVSPYITHRRSDACAYATTSCHEPGLLFFRTPQVGPAARAVYGGAEEKKVTRRRSFLASIFGGHNREASEREPPRRSTSWLSALVRRKRRTEAPPSPPRLPDDGVAEPQGVGSWWFPSPSPARHHRRRHRATGSGGEGISGFVVCLSPLVRPSSSGGPRRCQPLDPVAGCDNRRQHLSTGASFGRNTSRKLADMGRFR